MKPIILPPKARIITLDRRNVERIVEELESHRKERMARAAKGEIIAPEHDVRVCMSYDEFVEALCNSCNPFDFILVYKLTGNNPTKDTLFCIDEDDPFYMVSEHIGQIQQDITLFRGRGQIGDALKLENRLLRYYRKQADYSTAPTQHRKEINVLRLLHLIYETTRQTQKQPIYLIKHKRGTDLPENRVIDELLKCRGVNGVYILPYFPPSQGMVNINFTMGVVDKMMADKQHYLQNPIQTIDTTF